MTIGRAAHREQSLNKGGRRGCAPKSLIEVKKKGGLEMANEKK